MNQPSPVIISRRTAITALAALAASTLARPLYADTNPDWTTTLAPFRIAGNLYYVGSRDLAAYLVATSAGLILINSNLESSPPQIKASIEKLGFHYSDIKILLISHGHYDHCAGSARIVRETKASYRVMDADVAVVESGGKSDFHYSANAAFQFAPVKVSQALHDGEQVRLGEAVLTAHKTAGHTKGCTTWTLSVLDGPKASGKLLNAVIVGSPNVNPGYKLVNNPQYPQIAEDYAQGFRTLKSLPCDLFLGAHGLYFDLLEKVGKIGKQTPGAANPFIDPAGYEAYIAERQQAFEAELARQKSGKPPS